MGLLSVLGSNVLNTLFQEINISLIIFHPIQSVSFGKNDAEDNSIDINFRNLRMCASHFDDNDTHIAMR